MRIRKDKGYAIEKIENIQNFFSLISVLLVLIFVSSPTTALSPITTAEEGLETFESPVVSDGSAFEELGDGKDTGTRAATEIVTSTDLADGVYAFRNIGNGNLWMDLEQNIMNTSARIFSNWRSARRCKSSGLFHRQAADIIRFNRISAINMYNCTLSVLYRSNRYYCSYNGFINSEYR